MLSCLMSDTKFVWLLELPGPLYLHTARGDGVCGFTHDPNDAQQFATKEDAEIEKRILGGALGAQATEHGFG